MSVKRYDIVRCNEGMHEYNEIQERSDGDYVRFEDYARAAKERDSALFLAEKRLERIREMEQIP